MPPPEAVRVVADAPEKSGVLPGSAAAQTASPAPPVPSETPVLEVSGLHKRFAGAAEPALLDVALEIARAELVALVGESGCGKTTLLRIIAGLEVPDAGSVRIAGRAAVDAATWVQPELRGVGMVFQDYALFPHLTVLENVTYGLRGAKRARRERARSALALVGLEGLEARYPHELSGGQQQRVALARALAPEPTLLLLDEPFSNLDVLVKTRVREQVGELLRRSGTTALFVVHDIEDVLTIADRIAVLRSGCLLQAGSPEAVYRRPRNEYVARFFGQTNILPGWPAAGGYETPLGFIPSRNVRSDVRSVRLCLRPEDVEVGAAEGPGRAAVVRRALFRGIYQELVLMLHGAPALDEPLTAHVPGNRRYSTGDLVRVHARPDSAQVLAED